MTVEAAVTFDDVKTKTSFEDADLSAIKEQADKEYEAEHAPKDKEPEPEEKKEPEAKKEEAAPKKETDEKVEAPEDKAAKEAEAKKKDEERIIEAKDEDLKPEEKTRKAEILKQRTDEEVKAVAKEYSLTEDEARQSLEHVQKVRDKYKDSPKELAKANYFQQRHVSKLAEELKTLKATPPAPPMELNIDNVVKLIDKGAIKTKDGKSFSREQVVESFRKEYADITETLDDDTVLKLAAKEYIKGYESKVKEVHAEISAKAKEKRANLINSLSESDKTYLEDIKPILENIPDRALMDEGFSLADTVNWAKGKRFDTAVKEAEERGYKRGKEEAKILGTKKTPEPGKTGSTAKTRDLTAAEKKRALDMYDGQPISDDEKYKLFLQGEEEYKREKRSAK